MVDLADAAVAAILTRAPSSGGKSRLFTALGRAPDPALLAALLLDTCDAVRASAAAIVVAVEPADAAAEVGALLGGVEVTGQPAGGLGVRMASVMRTIFSRGARAVAIVGSDLPDLPPPRVGEAFAALDRDPAALVLGPAADGGYYLVAATRVPPVFDGIEWGTAGVLQATVAAAARQGLRVHLLEPVADVDAPADLRRVTATRTRAWVQAHLAGEGVVK